MNETIASLLMNYGYKLEDYIFIDKTCDNIKLKHKKSGKEVDVRW